MIRRCCSRAECQRLELAEQHIAEEGDSVDISICQSDHCMHLSVPRTVRSLTMTTSSPCWNITQSGLNQETTFLRLPRIGCLSSSTVGVRCMLAWPGKSLLSESHLSR